MLTVTTTDDGNDLIESMEVSQNGTMENGMCVHRYLGGDTHCTQLFSSYSSFKFGCIVLFVYHGCVFIYIFLYVYISSTLYTSLLY